MNDTLQAFLQLIKDLPSRKEFVDAFASVVVRVKRFEAKTADDIKTLIATVGKQTDAKFSQLDERTNVEWRKINARVQTELKGIDGKDGKDGTNGSVGPQGAPGATGAQGAAGKHGSPDTADDIRNKLELFIGQPEDEKPKIDVIGHLREELDELRKLITKKVIAPSGGVMGRDLVRANDISAQLNGVTKTFNTPGMWRVISINLSSFPNTLRETVDYTWTPTSITFTSQIDAASTLAAGQTCVIIYMSA